MNDKRLDDAITVYLRRVYRVNEKRKKFPLHMGRPPDDHIKPVPEKLPKLKIPEYDTRSPVKRYPYLVAFKTARKDWWRFKRAAYAMHGRTAGDLIREFCERVASQYEESTPEE